MPLGFIGLIVRIVEFEALPGRVIIGFEAFAALAFSMAL